MNRISLGKKHKHQDRVWRYAVRTMADPRKREFAFGRKGYWNSGILLADGVGMGKTYEALATAVGWLQRKSLAREKWQPRVLVLVPPALVRKWRDEVYLPDGWRSYLDPIKSQKKIYGCFSQPVVIDRAWSLEKLLDRKQGKRLAGGMYIVNWMQLGRESASKQDVRRRNLLKKTQWDVVIVDEAHLFRQNRFDDFARLVGHKDTRVVLLTATPFQLETGEIKRLFTALFTPKHGAGAWAAGDYVYDDAAFLSYRKGIKAAISADDQLAKREALKAAKVAKPGTEKLLRRLIVRNPSIQKRDFFVVNADGHAVKIDDPTSQGEEALTKMLKEISLIDLNEEQKYYYLAGLELLLPVEKKADLNSGHFNGFRHLLSSYSNFTQSKVGRTRLPMLRSLNQFMTGFGDKEQQHPRVAACVNLVDQIVTRELARNADQLGKTVVFVHFVKGTMSVLKNLIQARLKERLSERLPYGMKKGVHPYTILRRRVDVSVVELERILDDNLDVDECFREARNYLRRLRNTLGKPNAKTKSRREGFARTVARRVFGGEGLGVECDLIKRRLEEALKIATELSKVYSDENADEASDWVMISSLSDRLCDIMESLCDRYKARDLVQVISGELSAEEAAARRTAFNSPGAPLVLIASPVSQVGIDLQAYAEHVVHYELEWNPAKMEQREGRVDRIGRRTEGKVRVYYLICRDTYDERMFLQVNRRHLWHRLIVGKHQRLKSDVEQPGVGVVADLDAASFKRLALDLKPR